MKYNYIFVSFLFEKFASKKKLISKRVQWKMTIMSEFLTKTNFVNFSSVSAVAFDRQLRSAESLLNFKLRRCGRSSML